MRKGRPPASGIAHSVRVGEGPTIGWCILWCMQRVQIYLSDEQRRRVAERARERKCAQSEVIREILDRGLGIEHDAADVATVIRETAGVLAGEADWETWQRSVRGRSADERLEALGL